MRPAKDWTVKTVTHDPQTGKPFPIPHVYVMRGAEKLCRMTGDDAKRMHNNATMIAESLNHTGWESSNVLAQHKSERPTP